MGPLSFRRRPGDELVRFCRGNIRSVTRTKANANGNSDLGLYVLSAALTRRQAALISSFLEALKLPHEGPSLTSEGAIPAPAAKALRRAVDALLGVHEARDVALYLHAFASQPDVDWPVLEKLLESDARLALEDRSAS